jgi:hypothetical protein
VYFYQFSYDGIVGNISTDLEGIKTQSKIFFFNIMKQTGIDNVAHSEELRYMWRTLFEGYDNTNIEEFPEQDVVTHHRLLTLWTNFAKTLYLQR